jgi:acyl carrier protein phosphodiesterase
LRKSQAGAKRVCLRRECVFILEHFFASKSFDAVREAFSNAYPDKELPNKTTIHRLVTTFWNTGRRKFLEDCSRNNCITARVLWRAHCWERPWQPRSPDLTLPDFCLWGFLKDSDYSNNPRSLEELKNKIEQTVTNTKDGGSMFIQNYL